MSAETMSRVNRLDLIARWLAARAGKPRVRVQLAWYLPVDGSSAWLRGYLWDGGHPVLRFVGPDAFSELRRPFLSPGDNVRQEWLDFCDRHLAALGVHPWILNRPFGAVSGNQVLRFPLTGGAAALASPSSGAEP